MQLDDDKIEAESEKIDCLPLSQQPFPQLASLNPSHICAYVLIIIILITFKPFSKQRDEYEME